MIFHRWLSRLLFILYHRRGDDALQEQTSPIRMSIGYTVGGTVRQGIILYEAAPKVIETLIEKGYTCDLNGCGMRVYKL